MTLTPERIAELRDAPETVATAVQFAAARTGLRPDQVERVLTEYRSGLGQYEEPEWQALWHMSGKGFGMAQYRAEGTAVALQIERSGRTYLFESQAYETFNEARAVELSKVRPVPHGVPTP